MTAPQPKETVTGERIAWFAAYYKTHSNWGVFATSIRMNFHYAPGDPGSLPAKYPADLVDAIRWFARITPSQRRRVIQRAEDQADTIVRA